jgi:malate dehydrogenase (oxaloacetate-decarboxylating)
MAAPGPFMAPDESDDQSSRRALEYSRFYRGKIATVPKVPVRNLGDFSVWYTPGVAAVSRAIEKDADLSFEYTNRWNTIAILTDGSRVLGLGDVGPEASLPVMEGKALIYKYLGGVDAIAVPVRVSTEDEFVAVAEALEPGLGGINLEDIASPGCFDILERLRAKMKIPVWHDDQQGTAGVILAGLYNALEVTRRELGRSKIVLFGAGAANIAAARLLIEAGAPAREMILVDSKGTLHSEREDIDQLLMRNRWKYDMALKTNGSKVRGSLRDALVDADVLVAASTPGPNLIQKDDIRAMARDPIAFLLSNPVPEMWPHDALAAGAAVVATGRSDFANQVNNSVLFPGVFRGALDVRARTISDTMVIAAARELAEFAKRKGVSRTNIIPTMLDWDVFPSVAAVVGEQAQREGLARIAMSRDDLFKEARRMIQQSRNASSALIENGIIPPIPEEGPEGRRD